MPLVRPAIFPAIADLYQASGVRLPTTAPSIKKFGDWEPVVIGELKAQITELQRLTSEQVINLLEAKPLNGKSVCTFFQRQRINTSGLSSTG